LQHPIGIGLAGVGLNGLAVFPEPDTFRVKPSETIAIAPGLQIIAQGIALGADSACSPIQKVGNL
jgi:hypothetical protein